MFMVPPKHVYIRELTEAMRQAGASVECLDYRDILRPFSLLQRKPDVCHLHWLHPLYGGCSRPRALWRILRLKISLQALRAAGVRIVWTAHNLTHHENPRPRIDRAVTRSVSRLAHRIIAHSPQARDVLLREMPEIPAGKIAVIPMGHFRDSYPDSVSREDARRRFGLSDDTVALLFFGYLRPYKGVLEMIRAFRLIPLENTVLLIAGQSRDPDFSQAIRGEAEGDRRIMLTEGYVPDEDLQVYLKACDAVVLPYQTSLSSAVVVLAMSYGKPCIMPRIPGLADLAGEGEAFCYDPLRKEGLRGAMRRAIDSGPKLAGMGEAMAQKALRWSWRHAAEATLDIYR
jgi:glycosyltransferase involved in cell wall biosynthesis